MKNKIEILCTLGPASLNTKFLKFAKNKISLLRLNMSHIEVKDLKKYIIFIKKNTNIPICIDTEGAQIRTKINKKKNIKINQKFKIYKNSSKQGFYPRSVFDKLKLNDFLDIGFNDLKAKIIKKSDNYIILKSTSSGVLENNKGVYVVNRILKLNFLTQKDNEAIVLAKGLGIKNFALSFTNTTKDVLNFKRILPSQNKIYKIESKTAIKNLSKILKNGENFLIDRGDLSKEIEIENIPVFQRKIIKMSKKFKNKKVYIATNFLENMVTNKYPNRGEANDIYSSLEMGATGLVLAAETAIGKYPEKTVLFLNKMIKVFKSQKM